jgi:hypothetical protein
MADLIILGLVGASAILFMALTLDEVTRRIDVRSSNRSSPAPAQPDGIASQLTIESAATGNDEREAA